MARPIWTGTLSFGLLNVPVQLMSGERRTDLSFRMLDSRNNKPVRYERVNAETGEEVPWKDIVKAFEYDKGSYVVLEEEDIASAAPESHEAVEIEAFVDADAIDPATSRSPTCWCPARRPRRATCCCARRWPDSGKVGIARVVIRTREYLSAVMPREHALVLLLLRYPQELVDPEEYKLPARHSADYRITPKELAMARQLIDSMAGAWKPDDYHDEFRERLHKVIERTPEAEGPVTATPESEDDAPEDATTNVVDFMALLQKSLDTQEAHAGRSRPSRRQAGEEGRARPSGQRRRRRQRRVHRRKSA